MKHITETVKIENTNSIFHLIKGIGISYMITFILLFLFSVLLTYTNIGETMIAPVILMITVISILIYGGLIGFIYIMSLYIISSLIQTGFMVNVYAILMIVFSILAGMIRRNCSE